MKSQFERKLSCMFFFSFWHYMYHTKKSHKGKRKALFNVAYDQQLTLAVSYCATNKVSTNRYLPGLIFTSWYYPFNAECQARELPVPFLYRLWYDTAEDRT